MRRALGPGHRATFVKTGEIVFEDLLSKDELNQLETMTLAPTSPSLIKLIKKRQLAQIAYQLIDKEPLRIVSAKLSTQAEVMEGDCGCMIDLKSGLVTYTKLSLSTETPCILLVFTPRYLHDENHPAIFRAGA